MGDDGFRHFGLIPLGSVYFGGGHPSVAGEIDLGQGIFPPTPRTLQGAVRTRLLEVAGLLAGGKRHAVADAVGTHEALPDGWQIVGPWLARWTESDGGLHEVAPWLAAPAFLRHSDRVRGTPVWLGPLDPRSDGEDVRLPRTDRQPDGLKAVLLPYDERARDPFREYLSPRCLVDVLDGRWPDDANAEHGLLPPFVSSEPYAGIAIDTATAQPHHGMLYFRNNHRFLPSSGFLGSVRIPPGARVDPSAVASGTVAFGAKHRLARLAPVIEWDDAWNRVIDGDHIGRASADDYAWLFLTTPAAVADPAVPEISSSHGETVTSLVVATVVAGTTSMGAFSLADRRGGSTRRYLLPGTAWLLRIGDSPQRKELLTALHDQTTVGDARDRAFGFGHTLIARMPNAPWTQARTL